MLLRSVALAAVSILLLGADPTPAPAPSQSAAPREMGLWQMKIMVKFAGPQELGRVNGYIANHPQDGDGYAMRCSIAAQIGDMNDASISPEGLADCKKAIELSPKSGYAHMIYGDVLYEQWKFPDALAEYTLSIESGQTDDEIYWRRCDANRRTGNLDAALADCTKQLALTPKDTSTLFSRGQVEDARGDYAAAVTDFTTVMQRPALKLNADYWRGLAYNGLKQYAAADADFSDAMSLGDKSPDTYYQRGIARRNLGRTSDALADFTAALAGYQSHHIADGTIKTQFALSQLTGDKRDYKFAGISFTSDEITAFFGAVKTTKLVIESKSPAEMPQDESNWHYVSATQTADGQPEIHGWVSQSLSGTPLHQAQENMTILGLADLGATSPKWKSVYEKFKGAGDLPSLGTALAQLYDVWNQ